MQQLPGMDAAFLALETPEVHGHTGGLLILDPTGAVGFGFDRLQATVAERLPGVPRFRSVLREVPFGLDRPYWVEDSDFDVSRHFHRVAVPSPGGIRDLADLAGYLFSHKLERRRPLWEMWFIEGLDGGRVAILAKMHHCLMDGVSGAALGELLCDLEPNPPARTDNGPPSSPVPVHTPGDLELLARAVGHLALSPLRLGRLAGRSLLHGRRALALLQPGEIARTLRGAPRLKLNGRIGSRRAFATASVPLDAVKAVGQELGVTINDVVLALTSTALRHYLSSVNELPAEPLVFTCPVSTRQGEDLALGNQVTLMNVSCATNPENPVDRLLCIHADARKSKQRARAMTDVARAVGAADLGDAIPPALVHLGLRTAMSWSSLIPLPCNVLVSNVPGPPVPLYAAGARIEAMYPLSLLASGQGLNVTVLSFIDRLDFGFTADPDLVEDLWMIAHGVPLALAELQAALAARGQGRGAKRSRAGRKSQRADGAADGEGTARATGGKAAGADPGRTRRVVATTDAIQDGEDVECTGSPGTIPSSSTTIRPTNPGTR
jgi:diacylglycerol O-acyltransferase